MEIFPRLSQTQTIFAKQRTKLCMCTKNNNEISPIVSTKILSNLTSSENHQWFTWHLKKTHNIFLVTIIAGKFIQLRIKNYIAPIVMQPNKNEPFKFEYGFHANGKILRSGDGIMKNAMENCSRCNLINEWRFDETKLKMNYSIL